jgi:hypothetical protein
MSPRLAPEHAENVRPIVRLGSVKRLARIAYVAVVIAVAGTTPTSKALGISNIFVGSSFAITALVASLSFQQLGGAIVGTTRVAPYAADAIAFVAFGALLALSINRA